MIVNACTRAKGESLYRALAEGGNPTGDYYEVGGGSRAEGKAVVAAFRRIIVDLLAQCEANPSQATRLRFDAHAAEKVHAVLAVPDEISGDDAFWRYLALAESWKLATWRHGGKNGDPPAASHLGLGEKWWCLPRRLWLRGELSMDPDATDPYELTRRGGADFWMSGVIRHLYSGARPLVRSLIRFQYPEPGEFVGTEYRPHTLTLRGIRELYTRLQHFHAFIGLGSLDEQDATRLIESLAEGLPRGR